MSMIISIVGCDGIVMAADKARSKHIIANDHGLLLQAIANPQYKKDFFEKIDSGVDDNLSFCYSNTDSKIMLLKNNIAVSSGGGWLIAGGSIKPRLEHLFDVKNFDTPKEAAEQLSKYLKEEHPGLKAGFHVCGYIQRGNERPLPVAYFVNNFEHTVEAIGENGNTGMFQHAANGYMLEFSKGMANLIKMFSLQDLIEYAAFAVKASAMYEKYILLNNRIQGLDILTITPKGAEWVNI